MSGLLFSGCNRPAQACGDARKEKDMHRFHTYRGSHHPQALARTARALNDNRRAGEVTEPLMFARLFLVVGIFFAAIGGFHQFIG